MSKKLKLEKLLRKLIKRAKARETTKEAYLTREATEPISSGMVSIILNDTSNDFSTCNLSKIDKKKK